MPPPTFTKPMECTPVADIPDDASRWIYEVKLDGYRCCAISKSGKGFLYSRYGNLWTDRFAHIRAALGELKTSIALDGEIVALDEHGRPSFQELQNWQSTKLPIVFYAFDITHFGGRDVRKLPLEERKAMLAEAAKKFRPPLLLAESLDAKLSTLVKQFRKLGLEGIVAKRRGSLYESGRRSTAWLKHRFNETGEFVIGGYLPGEGPFARLLVGEWQNGELMFVKKLKNGFTSHAKEEILAAIRVLRIKDCPFANLPESKGRSAVDAEVIKEAVWVRPERIVEVEFVERTAGGKLRHAAFRTLVEPANGRGKSAARRTHGR